MEKNKPTKESLEIRKVELLSKKQESVEMFLGYATSLYVNEYTTSEEYQSICNRIHDWYQAESDKMDVTINEILERDGKE